jgi:hypothetical protein
MMKTDVPSVITSYFEASNANDIEALVALFSADANVSDENQTHRGTVEIKAWAQDVRTKFTFTTKVLTTTERDSVVVVTTNLSGDFPGSPVDLDYTFTLDKNKITSLEIG